MATIDSDTFAGDADVGWTNLLSTGTIDVIGERKIFAAAPGSWNVFGMYRTTGITTDTDYEFKITCECADATSTDMLVGLVSSADIAFTGMAGVYFTGGGDPGNLQIIDSSVGSIIDDWRPYSRYTFRWVVNSDGTVDVYGEGGTDFSTETLLFTSSNLSTFKASGIRMAVNINQVNFNLKPFIVSSYYAADENGFDAVDTTNTIVDETMDHDTAGNFTLSATNGTAEIPHIPSGIIEEGWCRLAKSVAGWDETGFQYDTAHQLKDGDVISIEYDQEDAGATDVIPLALQTVTGLDRVHANTLNVVKSSTSENLELRYGAAFTSTASNESKTIAQNHRYGLRLRVDGTDVIGEVLGPMNLDGPGVVAAAEEYFTWTEFARLVSSELNLVGQSVYCTGQIDDTTTNEFFNELIWERNPVATGGDSSQFALSRKTRSRLRKISLLKLK